MKPPQSGRRPLHLVFAPDNEASDQQPLVSPCTSLPPCPHRRTYELGNGQAEAKRQGHKGPESFTTGQSESPRDGGAAPALDGGGALP